MLTNPTPSRSLYRRAQGASPWTITPLSALVCLSALTMGCQRPDLGGVQAVDCGEGDRVVSLSRVFCVYDQLSTSDPTGGATTGGVGGTGASGGSAEQGGMSEAGQEAGQTSAGAEPLTPTCPEALPYAYQFAGLTICAREGGLTPGAIEAAAAQWAAEFGQRDPSTAGEEGGGAEGGGAEGGGALAGAQAGTLTQLAGDMAGSGAPLLDMGVTPQGD